MNDFDRFLEDFYERHPNWRGDIKRQNRLPNMSAELQKAKADFQMLAANDEIPWPDAE